MRLEGLEGGINKGPGIDSYDRYIYIHGTNKEDKIGTPATHGCIALLNRDIIELFDMVSEGTLVYIEPPPLVIDGIKCRSIHFVGIFGTGMSALAQYVRFNGMIVSGSDRYMDMEETGFMKQALEDLGCTVFHQDGKGINAHIDGICISTAIEETNPDMVAARALGIPIFHRSDLLSAIISSKKTIAVAGTSGKSTVTAMIFEFLTYCGKTPSLISGAPLKRLKKQRLMGNAFCGASDLLVVEADESDGTIVKYAPDISVVLNISKDHKEVDEIKGLFETLISKSKCSFVNIDDPILKNIPAKMYFGRDYKAHWRPDDEEISPEYVKLYRKGVEYHLSIPGRHNLENLMASLCVCEHLGCEDKKLAEGVKKFEGVARRFDIIKTRDGIYVVDDFAHNPAKIAAAVNTARGLSERIIAVYQPHGFGPTRFLKNEYISTFKSIFRKNDLLLLLPIYYAGGTAIKDITSDDIIKDLGDVIFQGISVKDRDELLLLLKERAKKGDCILVMGARDPSLTVLVKKIVDIWGDEIFC